MRDPDDNRKHQRLTEELTELLRAEGFEVSSAEGVQGYSRPVELHNDGYGDQEDKTPDVFGYDPRYRRSIIGEAKTGRGDFETDHSLTQYNVFLDQVLRSSGQRAMLYVIVPSSKVPEFNTLITHYIHPDYWGNLVLVSSKQERD